MPERPRWESAPCVKGGAMELFFVRVRTDQAKRGAIFRSFTQPIFSSSSRTVPL
jgi:hypothetical protein